MKENRKPKTKTETPEELDTLAEERAEDSGERSIFSPRVAIALGAVVALVFIVYSLVSLSGIHSQIRERTEELDAIKDEITVQEIKNDSMSKTYNLTDSERSDYMERIARDELDFVKEGERVFVNVSGE